MTAWKAWFDVRRRFFIVLALVLAHAVSLVLLFAKLNGHLGGPGGWELSPQDLVEIRRAARSYGGYMGGMWTGGGGHLLAVLAPLLALGGPMAESRGGTALLTLSLPVSRRRWVLVQAAVALGLLWVLTAASALVLLLATLWLEVAAPWGLIGWGLVVVPLGAFSGVGVGLLATAIARDHLRAGALAIGFMLLVHTLFDELDTRRFSPVEFLIPDAWAGQVPVASLLAAGILGLGGLALAILLFERSEP